MQVQRQKQILRCAKDDKVWGLSQVIDGTMTCNRATGG